MITYLTLNGELRAETNTEIIVNLKRKGWQDAPVKPSDDSAWVAGKWVTPPASSCTAEQWLNQNGLGGTRQPVLIYLKTQLQISGKTSPKILELENYLNLILSIYAENQNEKTFWPKPPYTFEEAVIEAIRVLS